MTRGPAAGVMPKALIFDTFGTVVDWRGSIISEGNAWGKSKRVDIDWGGFADRWRAGYAPAMEKVRSGELPWTKLDDLHRIILDQILMEFRMMPAMSEEEEALVPEGASNGDAEHNDGKLKGKGGAKVARQPE